MYPGKKLRLICAQEGCNLQFTTYSVFRKHLHYIHCEDEDNAETDAAPSHQTQAPELPSIEETNVDHIYETPDSPQQPTTSFQSLDMCASIISKLIASNVPNTVVSSTIESLEDFIDDLKCNLKEKVLNIVPQNNPSRESLENVFESFDNPFSALNTDNKLKRYFYRKWGIVQPVEVPLGIRYDTKRNRQTGAYEQLPVNDKFIYIPILKTFKEL